MPTPEFNIEDEPAPKVIGRMIRPGFVPGGFSTKFRGDSRSPEQSHRVRDQSREIREAANRVLDRVPDVKL